MATSKHSTMTTGVIWKELLFFSIPLLIGNLFQQLYNTVDSIVVGNYIGSIALAAVGASGPIINMTIGFFMGLATGAGVLISQYFGANDDKNLKKAIHTSVALTLVSSVILTIVGIILSSTLLSLIGTPIEVIEQSSLYLKIYFLGIIFTMLYNVGAGILRAIGDSKKPLYFLMVSCFINIVLDIVFVTVFDMGIAGVGIATLIAQATSSFLVCFELLKTTESYKVVIKNIKFDIPMLKKIFSIGLPSAFQQTIVSFSNLLVQSYINMFGAAAIAGFTTYVKIDSFLMMMIGSFNLAITTFVGQNVGASQYDRVKEGAVVCLKITSVITLSFVTLELIFGKQLIGLFTNDTEVIHYGYEMLKTLVPFYICLAYLQTISGVLKGVGKTKVPMYFMIFNFCILRQIILAVFMPMFNDVHVIYLGWGGTWATCALCLHVYYKKVDWLNEFKLKTA